jgi:hypothetical protein
MIIEVTGDIFTAPGTHALAHCIAQDQWISAMTAVDFVCRFGGQKEERDVALQVGDVGIVCHAGRVILYLVTKVRSVELPTQADFSRTLERLRSVCEARDITLLSCPLIGCGKDQLPISFVKSELNRVFGDSSVKLYLWQTKEGPAHPTACRLGAKYLVGDSNFLRVLGKRPDSQHGHILSGQTMYGARRQMASSPIDGQFVLMIGTNDLLHCKNKRWGKRRSRTFLRAELLGTRQLVLTNNLKVEVCTIPPLQVSDLPVTVEWFNGQIKCIFKDFVIKDVHSLVVQRGRLTTDGVHFTQDTANIVRNFLL